MWQDPGRDRHGAQQAVDAHAHHQSGPEGLDVNVAGAQLHRLLEHVVHGANHRRPAREVAQALDVVLVGARGLGALGGGHILVAQALVEDRGDVLEGRYFDRDVAAQHDGGGADGGGIARVGDRQHDEPVGRPIGKHRHFAQETPGELLHQGRGGQ